MTQFSLFSSGIELANLVVSSDLLQQVWAVILDLSGDSNQTDPTLPPSLKYRVYPHQLYGTVVAFVSSPTCTVQHLEGEGRDLISSATLKDNFPCFEFLSTKSNQDFSIHKAAIILFHSLHGELAHLKTQLDITKPLIITGHSIGGSIASLFTLWLLGSISTKATRRPLCITFGSALIGDYGFHKAILERTSWTSCFLHVASNSDPIPRLFASEPHDHLANVSTPQNGNYQPFGTFLLCSEFGCACFEEPESVSELLVAMRSNSVGNQDPNYYTRTLEDLKNKAICKGSSGLAAQLSTLQGGIITQLEAIGVKNSQPQQWGNSDINALITNVEERTKNLIFQKRNVFNPDKKLNDRKIVAYCEWYMKVSIGNRGYYDSYKNVFDQTRANIVKHHRKLTRYWKDMVAEEDKMPQEAGASFRTRWLYAVTTYRRMVEPLDIADYYRKGKRDYLTQGRSEHYILLEQWVNDAKTEGCGNNAIKRTAACSLTEDSCFWAHVEEAIISCKLLNARDTSQEDNESSRVKLNQFERYTMDLINNFGVSTEIFLDQSSFMQWWREYEMKMGTSYNSKLMDFIRSGKHKQYS